MKTPILVNRDFLVGLTAGGAVSAVVHTETLSAGAISLAAALLVWGTVKLGEIAIHRLRLRSAA